MGLASVRLLPLWLVMGTLIHTFILAATLLGSTGNPQVSFDVHIGPPPPPQAYRVPPQPGPDYEWVEGYYYPDHGHYKWHDGYWTRPPYRGAYWEPPYHLGGTYHPGRWDGDHGRVYHDHRWDHDNDRDAHHDNHARPTRSR